MQVLSIWHIYYTQKLTALLLRQRAFVANKLVFCVKQACYSNKYTMYDVAWLTVMFGEHASMYIM